jgi:putative endonuclease
MESFGEAQAMTLGEQGEMAAARYLSGIGYQILERNAANTRGIRLGEIDIVARDGAEIVFVEVKASRERPGSDNLPELRVDRHKLTRLERAATLWLSREKRADCAYRFDVVAVVFGRRGEVHIRHLDHVFLG